MALNPFERGDMRTQNLIRPRVVRGLPLVPPTEPKVEKKGLSKKAKAASTVGAIAVGGSTLGAVQHHIEYNEPLTPQGIYRDIQSVPGFWWDLSKSALENIQQMAANLRKEPVVVPSTFDPKATKGVIGENNSVQMTPQEFKKVAPPELEHDRVNMPLIIRLPEGVNRSIGYKLRKNDMGVKRKITTETGEVKEVEVYSNIMLNNLPVGAEILSAWDGIINQGTYRFKEFPDGSVESLQVSILTSDGKGNLFRIDIGTARVKPALNFPRSDLNPTNLTNDNVPTFPINKGDTIATIASPSNSRYFPGQVAINVTDTRGATNIGLAISPEGKLIVLQ